MEGDSSDPNINSSQNNFEEIINNFIVENRPKERAKEDMREQVKETQRQYVEDGQVLGTSRQHKEIQQDEPLRCDEEEKLDQMIREAENVKTKMFATPGKEQCKNRGGNLIHSVIADDDYLILGAHLDEHLTEKIIRGEYIDLAKLLPRDRLSTTQSEGQRLQLVIKGGQSFWVPMNDNLSINNFQKWEQAFRIFSDVYSRAHPHRSPELLQYCHVINMIASQYVWENVYDYDKDFRLHMQRHPDRSWSIILQQAWAIRLRDRIKQ